MAHNNIMKILDTLGIPYINTIMKQHQNKLLEHLAQMPEN